MATDLPKYNLQSFRGVHRLGQLDSPFGHNQLDPTRVIEGFELYSSDGIAPKAKALKADFYRMSVTITGSFDMQIGLDHYAPRARTLVFTSPNQIFLKTNLSADVSGYYILFNAYFLGDLIPSLQLADEFPFYSKSNSPVFEVSTQELDRIVSLILLINNELTIRQASREKAIKMYLYLILLEAKRSYQRQQLDFTETSLSENHTLINRFRKLVTQHFLTKRHVSDYAQLLGVSANHLNKTVKEHSGQTASDNIRDMLGQEAKSLLLYTDNSVAQVAYRLDFSTPAAFSRFFKTLTGQTPLGFRYKPD